MDLLRSRLTSRALILCLGVSLFPLYVFPSGGVQPSHALLAAFCLLVAVSGSFGLTSWFALMILTSAYMFVVEAFYGIASSSVTGLISPVFLLYNAIVSASVFSQVTRAGAMPMAMGVSAAATIALISVLVSGVDFTQMSALGRPTGTFNNPNQLGFFSTCLVSMAYVLYRSGNVRYVIYLLLVLSAVYLAVASLSKAAIVATASVVFVSTMPRGSRVGKLLWIAAVVAVLGFVAYKFSSGALDRLLVVQRLYAMANENDSSLASRGYFEFTSGNLAQVLFGLGEHNIRERLGREVHSTFASMLNAYGLVGLLLYLGVFGVWLKKLWTGSGIIGAWCIAGPSILYGLTHNGTRFTFFWLLFAVSIALSQGVASRHSLRSEDGRGRVYSSGRASELTEHTRI